MIILQLYLRLNKKIQGKRISSILGCVACIAMVTDHSNFKILSPKQMFQGLLIALVHVRTGNTSENLLNESD